MKHNIKRIIAVVLIGASLMPLAMANDMGQRHAAKKMFKQLDLDAEQKQQIKQIVSTSKENAKLYIADRMSFKEQVDILMSKPSWDASLAQSIVSEAQSFALQRAVERARTKHQMFQVLTPEQQIKFNELRSAKIDGEKSAEKGNKKKGKRAKKGNLLSKKMSKKLDLSDEQTQQIKQIKSESRQELVSLKEANSDFRTAMKAIIQADSFDEQALINLFQSNQANLQAKRLIQMEARYNMLAVLTEAQRAKFDAIKAKRMAKRLKKMSS